MLCGFGLFGFVCGWCGVWGVMFGFGWGRFWGIACGVVVVCVLWFRGFCGFSLGFLILGGLV